MATTALEVLPEIGVPLCPEAKYIDLRERAEAVCNTSGLLSDEVFGFDLVPTSEDEAIAAKLAVSYASNATVTSKEVTHKRAAELRPASLLLESEHPDPRVRLKAIELLGKVSDVGLFVEKTERVVTVQTSDELKEQLRNKLSKLVRSEEEITEAEFSIETMQNDETVIDDA